MLNCPVVSVPQSQSPCLIVHISVFKETRSYVIERPMDLPGVSLPSVLNGPFGQCTRRDGVAPPRGVPGAREDRCPDGGADPDRTDGGVCWQVPPVQVHFLPLVTNAYSVGRYFGIRWLFCFLEIFYPLLLATDDCCLNRLLLQWLPRGGFQRNNVHLPLRRNHSFYISWWLFLGE